MPKNEAAPARDLSPFHPVISLEDIGAALKAAFPVHENRDEPHGVWVVRSMELYDLCAKIPG